MTHTNPALETICHGLGMRMGAGRFAPTTERCSPLLMLTTQRGYPHLQCHLGGRVDSSLPLFYSMTVSKQIREGFYIPVFPHKTDASGSVHTERCGKAGKSPSHSTKVVTELVTGCTSPDSTAPSICESELPTHKTK